MSAFQSKKPVPITARSESLAMAPATPDKPFAAGRVISIGIALANANELLVPGQCSRCLGYRNPMRSTAQFPNIFCSQQCETAFLQLALASLTLQDCIRIQERLESLLTASESLVL